MKYSTSEDFRRLLGSFYTSWAATEFLIDFAIGRFLKIPDKETHMITIGMRFGSKCMLLKTLVSKSDHKNKSDINKHLKVIQNDGMRNIFAHSFIQSDEHGVIFAARSSHGGYSVTPHPFTPHSFAQHVGEFLSTTVQFENALAFARADLQAFGSAAYRLKDKS